MDNEEKIINAVKLVPTDQLLTLPYFENRGKRFVERALIMDMQGMRELVFSNTIKRFQEGHGSSLNTVLGSDDPVVIEAGLTMFQWLCTNVGSAILEEALKGIGREIVNIEPPEET